MQSQEPLNRSKGRCDKGSRDWSDAIAKRRSKAKECKETLELAKARNGFYPRASRRNATLSTPQF